MTESLTMDGQKKTSCWLVDYQNLGMQGENQRGQAWQCRNVGSHFLRSHH